MEAPRQSVYPGDEAQQLWAQILSSWKKGKTPEEYMALLEKRSLVLVFDRSSDPITVLKQELQRPYKERVMELRDKIKTLWEECYVAPETQRDFLEMESTDFNEAVMEAHEAEVTRWDAYYKENYSTIQAMNEWEASWKNWLEIKALDCDSNRFEDRGGALQKHLKNKRQAQKNLDTATETLKKLDADYAKAHSGNHFKVWGDPVLDYVRKEMEKGGASPASRIPLGKRHYNCCYNKAQWL